MASSSRIRVLILGGGFAGVYTAAALEGLLGDDVGVTLINRDNFFLVTPLLFEAASGVLEPRHAVMPIRRMFRRASFMQGVVQSIDLTRSVVGVELVDGAVREVGFDYLVLALGGVTNTKLIPGSEHGRTFKSLADAIALRNHCIRVFEEAEIESDAKRRAGLLTFVIVGGGLVGVELQGELTEFVKSIRSAYPSVKDEEIRFELIEAGPRLVPEMDEELGAYVEKTFKRRGVRVRLNTKVSKMEETKLFIGEEVIEAKTIVVATGVVPHPLIGSLALEKDGKGRLKVESSMRCGSNPKIWALGDCAAIPDPEGKPYPMLAQHALREAKCLARNLAAAIGGGEVKPFVYKSKGTLASLGHYQGVGKVYKFKIYGLLAWWVWRTYYLMQMPRWSRRVRMVIDWTVALFFKNDVVELDMSEREKR